MSDVDEEFLERLKDDVAGLRDALDIGDWDGLLKIAGGLSADCPTSGWPLVGRLAGDLCSILAPEFREKFSEETIEVLVNAVGMAIGADIREEENMHADLRAGLELLRKRFEF